MSNENVKFPLSKKAKAEFSDKYEAIFLKKPVHNIGDEKLVEMVNANLEKLPNAENQKQPSQEGIQDDEDQSQNGEGIEEPIVGEGSEPNVETGVIDNGEIPSGTDKTPEQLKAEAEREYQFNQYKELHGEEADENLSTEEVTALSYKKLALNTASVDYFGLFGKRPLAEMTLEQVLSANENERKRQGDAKRNEVLKAEAETQLDFNPETEMIVVNKKNKSDKRVINKVTFPFLKEEFEEVANVPIELKNRK